MALFQDDAKPRPGVDQAASENFNEMEFACKCCGYVFMHGALVDKLEALRAYLGAPVVMTCSYRCPPHNAEVGGVPNSEHTQGTAADIYVEGVDPETVAQAAEAVGFDGVGRYSDFTHVDVRGYYARWNG